MITHDVIAIMLPIPKTNSMKKKRTENTCGTQVNFDIVSGYVIKTRPGPPLKTLVISSTFSSCFKCPTIPNVIQPARIDVNVSIVVTIFASR